MRNRTGVTSSLLLMLACATPAAAQESGEEPVSSEIPRVQQQSVAEITLPAGATTPELIAGQINADDYPSAARRAGEQGATVVRFRVGTDGTVNACETIESSGSDLLDQRTCALILERFRYRPARDADGKAIAVTRVQSIRWQIDHDGSSPQVMPLVAGSANARVAFDADGNIVSCSGEGTGPMADQIREGCAETGYFGQLGALPKVPGPMEMQVSIAQAFDVDTPQLPGMAPGFTIFMKMSIEMTLDDEGAIASCKMKVAMPVLEMGEMSPPCDPADAPFRYEMPDTGEPMPNVVHMQMRMATNPSFEELMRRGGTAK